MATEQAVSEEVGVEESKEQLQAKSRVCDYYISARGCVKVSAEQTERSRARLSPHSLYSRH